ncbi:MAG TPA: GAF domain-containing sensor histidine kinase [Thermoanaerobaculia bacterium]|nr:GAF domain-containing sensor histidine kinase [Thermoanaerobaculia bacterium]
MTLRQLRWLAIVAPIVVVALLELARVTTIGVTSIGSRIVLDGLVAAALVIVSTYMVRAVGRMQHRLERHNQELLALHGAGLDVTAELSLDVVLNKVVDRARTLVGSRYGALSVVNADGSIQTFITAGVAPDERARIGPPPVGHGLLGVVLNEGERLRLPDIGKDPRSYGFPPNHPVMHSLLAVPISCKGPFVGNLYLSEKEGGGEFTPGDEETLERFAVQAAIAIDNAHLHRQVADLAVAQERLRIAHEMHDGIAQVLGYVNTKVQAAIEYLRQEKKEEGLVQLRELAAAAREAYGDVREAIVDLRTLPGPARAFDDVLREYIDRWKEQSGVDARLVIEGDLVVPNGIELQLVRIIQESLTNVRKHAKATMAMIEVRRHDGKLLITVSDDGAGFAQAGLSRRVFPRFGLSTMRERAESIGGTFSIESTPGGGTVVSVEVPMPG